MALIHILDKQTDEILETLDSNKKEFTEAIKIDNLNLKETFDFKAISTIEKSSLLQKRNRIVVKDEDGFFREYIISEVDEYRRGQKDVYSDASYIDLKKAKVIEPQALEGQTPATAVEFALSGTEWKAGEIEFVNIRSIDIDDFANPYDLLKKIASTFDLEIRFRVEIKGGRIVGRYVDMVKQRAGFEGKEIGFGKDLIGVKRTENSANIVTALFGVGPEKEDGTRLTILVANEEALQRWGRNGKHLIDVYEPQSDNMDMTLERLKTLTEAELKKRIDASVIYEVEAVGIENVKGLEHEKIRIGQVVRIKDTSYYPPLYLEARIQESEFDPILKNVKRFKIGEFIEFKKEDLEAKLKVLKELLKLKASSAEVVQVKTYAEEQAQQAKREAITQAEFDSSSKMEVAKVYAVEQAKQAETNVKTYVRDYSISQELFNQTYEQMIQEIADKAGLEYVDGQLSAKANIEDLESKADLIYVNAELSKKALITDLVNKADLEYVDGKLVSKADKDTTYTKIEVDNALNSKVSVLNYNSDKEGIITQLSDHESRVTQTENELRATVKQTQYDLDINNLNTNISNVQSDVTQQAELIATKVNKTDYNTDKEGIITQLSDHESRVTQTETEISTRVTKTEFNAGLAGKESTVFKQTTAPTHMNGRLWLDTSKTPNILYRSDGTKWVKATPTTAGEVGAYSNTDGNTLATKLSNAESNITQLSDQIALKVAKTDYELDKSGILSRLNTAESSITQQKDMIEARVTKTEFDNLQVGGVNLIQSSFLNGINTTKDFVISGWNLPIMYNKHVLLTFVEGEECTLSYDVELIEKTTIPDLFQYNVGFVLYSASTGLIVDFRTKEIKKLGDKLKITKTFVCPKLASDHSLLCYTNRYTTGGTNPVGFDTVRITNLQLERGNIATDYSPSPQDTQNQIDGLGTRVTTAESTITQLDNQIKLKVSKTDYNTDKTGILSRLNTAESSITQNANNIATKVSQTTYDLDIGDLTSRVGTAESTINQQADMISTKVEKNGVISAINQSPESIKLNANRIDLTGYTTFSDLSTPGKTTISGSNVRTGTIKVGGNANGNGQLEVVDANNGLIFRANQNGIVDGQGREIVGKGGVHSVLVYSSSGIEHGWQWCGWNDGGGVYNKVDASIKFEIPANFQVVEAVLSCYSMPLWYSNPINTGVKPRWVQPRHMKLYKTIDELLTFYDYVDLSDVGGMTFRSGNAIDISANVFGASSWDPITWTTGDIYDFNSLQGRVQRTTRDVKNYVSVGTNEFFLRTENNYEKGPDRNLGLILIQFIIKGFQK